MFPKGKQHGKIEVILLVRRSSKSEDGGNHSEGHPGNVVIARILVKKIAHCLYYAVLFMQLRGKNNHSMIRGGEK